MKKSSNITASIRAKLNNEARTQQIDFGRLLTRYGLERLLYRLANSPYKDEFVLKGALLFSYWSGDVNRATKDADFLKMGESSIDKLEQVFTQLCEMETDVDDGLVFDTSSIKAQKIRAEDRYGGTRVTLKAYLGKAMISIQADIGVGDMITPAAKEIEFPTVLNMPSPKLKGYPVETVIAEKFEAMVSIGFINSRMKDFYDIWAIYTFLNPNTQVVKQAIINTFRRRETIIPNEAPLALTDEFSKNKANQQQWLAFVRRAGVTQRARPTLHPTFRTLFLPYLYLIFHS